MHSFKDRSGCTWTVDITVATIDRVEDALKIDLPGLFADRMQGLDALLADDRKLSTVVFHCCKPAEGQTIESLKAEWAGETADLAVEAFMEELIDFFRDPSRRSALRSAVQKLRKLGEMVLTRGAKEVDDMDLEKMTEAVLTEIRRTGAVKSETKSGSLPGSVESIPDPSPSGSSP